MHTELPLHGVRDRMLIMRSIDTFQPLDRDGLTLLAEHARHRQFRAGETLMVEGGPPAYFHLVISGRVEVTRRGQRVAMVERGRSAGVLSILSGDDHGVTAVAVTDARTFEMPTEAMLNAFEENFSLVRNSLRLGASAILRQRAHLPRRPDDGEVVRAGEPSAPTLTFVERIIQLRRAPIFSQCNLDALIELVRRGRVLRGRADDVLWRVGDPSTFWLRFDHGIIRCTSPDGETVDIGENFVLGIMDSMAAQERSFEARAVTDYAAFRTDLDPFLAVIETHFSLARDMVALLSRHLLTGN